jgi:hypothetical protein
MTNPPSKRIGRQYSPLAGNDYQYAEEIRWHLPKWWVGIETSSIQNFRGCRTDLGVVIYPANPPYKDSFNLKKPNPNKPEPNNEK